MPSLLRRGSSTIRRSGPTRSTLDDPAPPEVGDGRRARPGEQRARRRRHPSAPGRGTGRSGRRGRPDGRRPPSSAPPSTRSCSTPRRPSSSSTPVEVTGQLEAGVHLRVARRRARAPPAAGRAPSTWRTVSAGSSARTVPAPTSTASLSARSRWASARASSLVIHWLVPSAAAVRPSRRGGQLQHHQRTTGAPVVEVGRELLADLRRPSTPARTSTPAAQELRHAPPGDLRVRVLDADHAPGRCRRRGSHRCTAACGRGGSRARGSRPASSPGCRRRRACAADSAAISACGPPGGEVAPSKRWPPVVSSTAPTQGFGAVVVRTDAASSIARRIISEIAHWCAMPVSAPVRGTATPNGPGARTHGGTTRHAPLLPSGL